jgi:hypothetical protein
MNSADYISRRGSRDQDCGRNKLRISMTLESMKKVDNEKRADTNSKFRVWGDKKLATVRYQLFIFLLVADIIFSGWMFWLTIEEGFDTGVGLRIFLPGNRFTTDMKPFNILLLFVGSCLLLVFCLIRIRRLKREVRRIERM